MNDKRPQEISVILYDHPTLPIDKTTFYDNGKKQVTIITHNFVLAVNVDLSEDERLEIQKFTKKLLSKKNNITN